jgi:hypothetical protein
MSRRVIRIEVVIHLLIFVVQPAAAQSEPPAFSVAAGAGVAFPFHGDFDFNAFDWHASIRTRVAKHVVVEGMFDEWRHTTRRATDDVTFRTLAGSVLGHADQVRTDDARRTGVLGLNFLLTGGAGRLRIAGGGGPSLLTFRNTYSTSYTGCTTTTTSGCRDFTNTNSEATFAAQAILDVDVAITPNISAFGRALIVGPPQDPGAGHLGLVAGARFSLR